ncbi:MAG: hypothetical protein NMNS01_29580 [Nitrosomonas sp.]|nr:MAG: hypothetical protein NMNS01_29580 [Nitrosomonas sp.]
MYVNQLTKINLFLLLAFVLTGCENRILSFQLSKDLEELADMKIGAIVLVDGNTSKTAIYRHNATVMGNKTILNKKGWIPATELENMTSIIVQPVFIDENFQFCNFIKIDSQIELICRNTVRQESNSVTQEYSQSKEVSSSIPPELATQLEMLGKDVNNLVLFFALGFGTDQIKLFINESKGYKRVPTTLPQPISEKGSISAFQASAYRTNPCWVEVCDAYGKCHNIFDKNC